MDQVPIEFEHKGKHYSGFLERVSGAGSNQMWHLSVNKYHMGQLFIAANGWKFYSNHTPELNELAQFFSDHLSARDQKGEIF